MRTAERSEPLLRLLRSLSASDERTALSEEQNEEDAAIHGMAQRQGRGELEMVRPAEGSAQHDTQFWKFTPPCQACYVRLLEVVRGCLAQNAFTSRWSHAAK